ncbi:hypothetical protein V6N13_004909 [Hibiscus sabdariffa]|uniref:Uncharacterized protein n=1 Tax=Hibiscus sabdariffa TaxID=183260 RepID=A0ABR2S0A5_9ROSI
MGSWLFLELRQQLFVGPGFIPPNYWLLPCGSRPALQNPEGIEMGYEIIYSQHLFFTCTTGLRRDQRFVQ